MMSAGQSSIDTPCVGYDDCSASDDVTWGSISAWKPVQSRSASAGELAICFSCEQRLGHHGSTWEFR